jgi:hypothetical protein
VSSRLRPTVLIGLAFAAPFTFGACNPCARQSGVESEDFTLSEADATALIDDDGAIEAAGAYTFCDDHRDGRAPVYDWVECPTTDTDGAVSLCIECQYGYGCS